MKKKKAPIANLTFGFTSIEQWKYNINIYMVMKGNIIILHMYIHVYVPRNKLGLASAKGEWKQNGGLFYSFNC